MSVVKNKKYGFDFDGVIHKSVGITNLSGVRSGKKEALISNQIIIDKIKALITSNNEIEIISSRKNQDEISKFLKITFTSTEINSITINKEAACKDKTDVVINSDIVEFYDDSVNVLKEIIWALEDKPTIKIKLFLVRPELNDFIQIFTIKELENELLKLNIRLLCDKSITNEIDTNYNILKKNINILINNKFNHQYIAQYIQSDNVYWMLYKIIINRPDAQINIDPELSYTAGIVKETLDEMFLELNKLTTPINNIKIRHISQEDINSNNILITRANIDNWNVDIGETTGIGDDYKLCPGLITIVTDNLPDFKIKCLFQKRKVIVPRRINIYGTIYKSGTSDFSVLIKNNPKNKLFIYNENRVEFLKKSSLGFGSGNGFLRRARLDYKGTENQFKIKKDNNLPEDSGSLGIPTDVNGQDDEVIEQSITQIYNEINKNYKINDVYYSIANYNIPKDSDKFMDLGLQTFSGDKKAEKNIKYISIKLREMFNKLTTQFEVNLFVLNGETIEKITLDDPRINNNV